MPEGDLLPTLSHGASQSPHSGVTEALQRFSTGHWLHFLFVYSFEPMFHMGLSSFMQNTHLRSFQKRGEFTGDNR